MVACLFSYFLLFFFTFLFSYISFFHPFFHVFFWPYVLFINISFSLFLLVLPLDLSFSLFHISIHPLVLCRMSGMLEPILSSQAVGRETPRGAFHKFCRYQHSSTSCLSFDFLTFFDHSSFFHSFFFVNLSYFSFSLELKSCVSRGSSLCGAEISAGNQVWDESWLALRCYTVSSDLTQYRPLCKGSWALGAERNLCLGLPWFSVWQENWVSNLVPKDSMCSNVKFDVVSI